MKPPSNGLTLRVCRISDLDKLITISKNTFIAAFKNENDPKDFADYIEAAFSREQLQKELMNKDSLFHFVYEGSQLVGYFKVNWAQAQTDVKDENALELERIYVLQEYQGKGIGEWLLQQIVAIAKKAALKYVWLGVWEHNPRAIRFYLKNGFTKFGTHPYYIGKDKQTDWLLRLML